MTAVIVGAGIFIAGMIVGGLVVIAGFCLHYLEVTHDNG